MTKLYKEVLLRVVTEDTLNGVARSVVGSVAARFLLSSLFHLPITLRTRCGGIRIGELYTPEGIMLSAAADFLFVSLLSPGEVEV